MAKLLTILSALSEPTRLAILRLLWLAERDLCLCEIMDDLCLTQARASRHLTVLKNAGLICACQKDGWAHYRRNPKIPPSTLRVVENLLDLTPEWKVTPSSQIHLTKKGSRCA